MAEQLIVELLVDASGTETGARVAIASLNTIAEASQRAADSVDRLSTTLERVGRASATQQSGASASTQTADALAKQEQATFSATAALGQLRAAQAQILEQRAQLAGGAQLGAISSSQAAQMAEYNTQLRQLTEAMAQLRAGASTAEVMERFPLAFRLAAEAAGQTTEAFAATTRGTKALADAFLPLDEMAARARASFTALAEKWAPAAASLGVLTRDMAALTEAQSRGIIVGEQYARVFSGITAAQREFAADQAALSQRLWNIRTGVERQTDTQLGIGSGLGSALPANGFPVETAKQSAAIFQEQFALADSAQKVREQIDPLGAAYARYNAQVAQLNTLLATTNPRTKESFINETEHAQAVRQAADAHHGSVLSYMESSKAIEEVTTKTKASTNEFFLNRQGTLELRASAVNAFQAIAAGMNPLFVAQMEGAQVLGAFGQGLKLSLAEMLKWGIPIVGIVGGLALIVLHAKEAEDTLRSFNIQLDTIAKGSQGPDAAGLLELRNQLRDTGSSAADATKMIDTMNQATSRGVNRAAAPQLTFLARDIAAATGGDATQEMTKLTNALAGGVDELTKYGFELNALSAPQAAQARQLAEQGHAADGVRLIIEALVATYKGTFGRSLSDTATLMIELKDAWNSVLDTLSKSGVFEVLVEQIKGVAEGIKDTVKEFNVIKDFINSISDIPWLRDLLTAQGRQPLVDLPKLITGQIQSGAGIASGFELGSGIGGLSSVPAGGVGSLDTRGLNISSADLQRLTTVIDQGAKGLPEGYTVFATSTTGGTHTPGSEHYNAGAIDIQIVGPSGSIPNRGEDTTGMYSRLAAETYLANQKMFPGTPLAWGGNFGVTPGSTVADLMHFDVGSQRGNLGTPLPDLVAARAALLARSPGPSEFLIPGTDTALSRGPGSFGGLSAGELAGLGVPTDAERTKLLETTRTQTDAVNKNAEANQRELAVLSQQGAAQKLAAADLAAFNKANQDSLSGDLRKTFLADEHAKAVAEIGIENKKAAAAAQEDATGTLKSADAYQRSTVEGLKETAMVQARAQARTGVISVEQAYSQIITKNAVDAIAAGAQQNAALQPVIAGNARLAEAASLGTAELHKQELANDAITRSQDEVNKALATGNQALIDAAKAGQERLLVSIRDNEVQKETLSIRTAINQSKDQVQVLQLETSATLQGQSTEQIRAQVTLLQTQQHIRNDLANTKPEEKQALIDQTLGLIAANQQLAEAQRQTQRMNDAVRSVADTIDNQLVTRLDDFLSGKKVQDWGATFQQVLRDIIKQIVDFAFIKPLIGTALGALGFGQVAQQFGSFGGLGGALGGLGGGSSGGATLVGSDGSILGTLGQGSQAFNMLSNASSMPGLLPSWLGNIGGSSGGGLGGIFNSIGGSLGFAQPLAGGSFGGLSAAELADLGVPTAVPGSLFGGTTLGSFLGGAGAGFGAGTLINSLIGGNKTTGTIGSAGGALAGAVIGSIVPGIGTLLGGLLGGAGGGVFGGMFGNNKPSNNASGAEINLYTGSLTGSSGGVAANDQALKQITDQLLAFNTSIKQFSGGTAIGLIGAQVGSRDGTKITYTDPNGATLTTAGDLNAIELAIAQNLAGVSATLRTVLAHITDPNQVQDAVKFAAAYDSLKTAADSAFSSISTDAKTIGPFQTAMQTIQKTFADLTGQAIQFGLSLDPVNAGLAEATKRLQGDFDKALDQAINSASGAGGGDFINQLTAVSETFASNTREAAAIGHLSAPVSYKISDLEIAQARNILGGLTGDQLKRVVDVFGTTNPEIATMAQELLNMGGAANAAGAATQTATARLQDLATGIKSIGDLAQSLRTGPLSGLTPAQAVAAKSGEYQAALGAVQGAGAGVTGTQLSTLATAGQAAIEASRTAYGEGPQTAALRRTILSSLDAVSSTANAAYTTGTAAPGTAATGSGGVLSIDPTTGHVGSYGVLLAQNTATSAILHAAGVAGFAMGTHSTPPGWIMVGEAGPELMYQPGGASVVPINSHAAYQWRGPSFAAGTGSGGSIEQKLDALVGEVAALRKQTQGGQAQAAQDANTGNAHLGAISTRLGPGIVAPVRRSVA